MTTITELDVTFTPAASPFTDLLLTTPPPAGGSTISSAGDTVTVTIAPSASAAYILLDQAFANLGNGAHARYFGVHAIFMQMRA